MWGDAFLQFQRWYTCCLQSTPFPLPHPYPPKWRGVLEICSHTLGLSYSVKCTVKSKKPTHGQLCIGELLCARCLVLPMMGQFGDCCPRWAATRWWPSLGCSWWATRNDCLHRGCVFRWGYPWWATCWWLLMLGLCFVRNGLHITACLCWGCLSLWLATHDRVVSKPLYTHTYVRIHPRSNTSCIYSNIWCYWELFHT